MGKEIERKFLLTDNNYRNLATRHYSIKQGYLSTQIDAVVRVRIIDNDAFITIKSRNRGISRDEWEYPIPLNDAVEMLAICKGHVIDKHRYIIEHEGYTWEIDEFHGRHQGLVIAEIELTSEDQTFSCPPFIGQEITGDPQYYNSTLSGID